MATKIRELGANVGTFFSALIPIFKSCPPCPVCMPKYAMIFAFFGLELADYSAYLIPVMLGCTGVSLCSMYYQTKKKKTSFAPLFLALGSAATLLVAKFVFDNLLFTYVAMLGFFCAILLHYYYMSKNNCCNTAKSCIAIS